MREIETWMIEGFRGNSALTALLGSDSNGIPAIFPDVMKDSDERVPYPHITVTRFTSIRDTGLFDQNVETAGQFDCPRIAVCGWSTRSKDEAYHVYALVDQMLRGSGAMAFTSQYFSGFKIKRTTLRDNLFDDKAQAYHVHSEYAMWASLTTTAQPY